MQHDRAQEPGGAAAPPPEGQAPGGFPLLLRAVAPGEGREAALRLLAGTGRPLTYLRAWSDEGEIFALCDPAAGPAEAPLGAVLAYPVSGGRVVELRAVTVPGPPAPVPVVDDGGLGQRMLAGVADALRARGVHRVLVAASNAEEPLMALLLSAGMRFAHVERDAATPEHGFPQGDDRPAHRDLLWFDQDL